MNIDWLSERTRQFNSSTQRDLGNTLLDHFVIELIHRRRGIPVRTDLWGECKDLGGFLFYMHAWACNRKLLPIVATGRDFHLSPALGLGLLKPEAQTVEEDESEYEDLAGLQVVYGNDDTVMSVSIKRKIAQVSFSTCSPEIQKEIVGVRERWFPKESTDGKVHLLIQSDFGGLKAEGVRMTHSESLIRDNYSEEVLDGFDKAIKTLMEPLPFGRLIILDGPQGTGKSHMVRAFIHDVPGDRALFLFISSNMIPKLGEPSIVPTLMNLRKPGRAVVLVVEDADEALIRRNGNNEAPVSMLLNLTDGILGDLLDIRVICTTNRKIADLDKAVVRNGRLACHPHFDLLPMKHARSVYDRITGTNPDSYPPSSGDFSHPIQKAMALGDIYSLAAGHEGNEKETKSVGFQLGGSSK